MTCRGLDRDSMNEKIENLLPQREPFLFLDEIIFADPGEIIGVKEYDDTFPYYRDVALAGKAVPGVILLESLIQCGGGGTALLGRFKKILWGLAAVEKVSFSGTVTWGNTVTMTVKNLKVSRRILKQTGTASVDGKTVLTATWLCVKLEER